MSRRISLLLLLVCTVFLVAACSADYSGQYGGLSDAGIFVSMVLNKDGTAETNLLGIPVTGTYTLKNDQITVKLTTMGYSQSVQGRITKDTIEFSDVILKKGVSSVDISEVSSLLGGTSENRATATPTAQVTTKPTEAPQSEAEVKFNEAEKLFAIGHYDEAIAIYDEIASEIDVEERRAYAVECRDIRDLYFDWSYNMHDSNVVSNGLVLQTYTGYGMDEVVIPYGTCCLSSATFRDDNADIISVILPDTLQVIYASCFAGCDNLESINLPSSIEYLALNDTGIKELTVPASVKTIPSGAFAGCSKLKTVTFEGQPSLSLNYNGTGIFSNCTSLESITVPASFKQVPSWMFSGCTSLKSVIVEDGITAIENSAFDGCSQLESVVLPDSIINVGRYAFENCLSLEEIIWPQNADTIPKDCFTNCTSLSRVVLPDTLVAIEQQAFEDCISLRSFTIPKSIKSISHDAFGNGYYSGINGYDSDIKSSLTLQVIKGTYGQRFAEECGLSYIFSNDTTRVPLGYRFSLGNFNGKTLEWIVIAHNGDKELAISIHPVASMAYHKDGGEPTYSDSAIKSWLENDFYFNAFSESDRNKLSKVQLLPSSYYKTFICEK